MHELHDRVTITKDGKKITGKITDIFYDPNKEIMVLIESDNHTLYTEKMSELNR